FQDYAALVPGLSLESSNPGQTRLTLRGQNAGGVGSTVAVYIDESPFGSSTALLNGSIVTGDFDTWDVQRVEVLRGPQGTLYGANSEGGLIKFVTQAPVLHAYQAEVEAGADSVRNKSHGGDGGWSKAWLTFRSATPRPSGSTASTNTSPATSRTSPPGSRTSTGTART